MFRGDRRLRRAALVWVASLHVAVAVLLARTDALPRLGRRLGVVPPEERPAALLATVVEQARQDLRREGDAPLVLLGDSLAAQLDAARIVPGAVNYGLGGDTVRTLLWRLPLLRSVERAGAAAVVVGVNDLKFRPVPTVAEDYRTLLAAFPPALPLLVVSPLPVDARVVSLRHSPGLRNADLRALGAALRPLCAARPGCRFVDAWPAFLDGATGGLRAALHDGDGIHLSADGVRALEALARRGLAALPPPGGG